MREAWRECGATTGHYQRVGEIHPLALHQPGRTCTCTSCVRCPLYCCIRRSNWSFSTRSRVVNLSAFNSTWAKKVIKRNGVDGTQVDRSVGVMTVRSCLDRATVTWPQIVTWDQCMRHALTHGASLCIGLGQYCRPSLQLLHFAS